MSKKDDRFIAEKVMGWERIKYANCNDPCYEGPNSGHCPVHTWKPSSCWRDATKVIEKLTKDGWEVGIEDGQVGLHPPYGHEDCIHYGFANSIPLALARACRKAFK